MGLNYSNIEYFIDNFFELTIADELKKKFNIDISDKNQTYSVCVMLHTMKTNLQDNESNVTTDIEGVLTINNSLELPIYHCKFKYSCSDGSHTETHFDMKLKETFPENLN